MMKTERRLHSVAIVLLTLLSVTSTGCMEESSDPLFVETKESKELFETISKYKINWMRRNDTRAISIKDHRLSEVVHPSGEKLGDFYVIPDNNITLSFFNCPLDAEITFVMTDSQGTGITQAIQRITGIDDSYTSLPGGRLTCDEKERVNQVRVLDLPDGAYKIRITASDKTSIREFFFDTVPPETPVMLSPQPMPGISANSSTINIEDPTVTFKGRVASDVIYLKGEVSDPRNSTAPATSLVLRLERSTGEFTFNLDIGFKESRIVKIIAVDVAGHESPPLLLTVYHGGAMELIQPMFSAIGLPVLQSEGMEGNQVRLTAMAGGSIQAHRHPSGTTAPPQIGDEDAPYWISSLFLDWVRKKQTTETSP